MKEDKDVGKKIARSKAGDTMKKETVEVKIYEDKMEGEKAYKILAIKMKLKSLQYRFPVDITDPLSSIAITNAKASNIQTQKQYKIKYHINIQLIV